MVVSDDEDDEESEQQQSKRTTRKRKGVVAEEDDDMASEREREARAIMDVDDGMSAFASKLGFSDRVQQNWSRK